MVDVRIFTREEHRDLAAGVDVVDAEEITLSTLDPMKPAVVRPVGREDYLYLLMPVRLTS